jgi:hypothetical protein
MALMAHRPMSEERARNLLLMCGIGASVVYVGTDQLAAVLYPGFRLSDQAVSELFAIGAPTSHIVVPLFSLSSVLLLGFAWGTARSAQDNRAARLLALMIAASAIDALVLWNAFPMHMRGQGRTFTDAMHLVLGANPFVWLAIGFAAAAFRNWFRPLSLAVLVLLLLPALLAFRYAPALDAGQATPGLGLAERVSQYGYQLWQVALALLLLRRGEGRFG